jgi:hypothetical protein
MSIKSQLKINSVEEWTPHIMGLSGLCVEATILFIFKYSNAILMKTLMVETLKKY